MIVRLDDDHGIQRDVIDSGPNFMLVDRFTCSLHYENFSGSNRAAGLPADSLNSDERHGQPETTTL
ncbi:MAG: hypothetical protein ABJF50_05460 [Paracoccaceae bacterium]